jgi:pimeloyl-ACP methyl ester carboxylesterase
MNDAIVPRYTTIDGLSIRFAQSTPNPDSSSHALLLSPWPESVYAFDRVWNLLSRHANLTAIDPPGFGQSEYRQAMMNPQSAGDFIVRVADHFGLSRPHLVGPDIGTSSSLFAAAAAPDRFASLVVGGGGVAVPIHVAGVLREWIEAPSLDPYRQIGGRRIVEMALSTIEGYTPPDEIREDYIASYRGDRFAETIPYAQSYLTYLPILADLLHRINTPVRVVAGADDQVVPSVNSEYLRRRLPHSRVDYIAHAGHFCWEEKPDEFAGLVAEWWQVNP